MSRAGRPDARRHVAIGALVALSLGLKGAFLIVADVPSPVQDAALYLRQAQDIWSSGLVEGTSGGWNGPNAPLYPILLAPFVGLDGPVPMLALAAQCALSTLVPLGAWWLGSRISGPWGGWGAGLLSATYPPLVAYPFRFLTETVAAALLIGAMALTDVLLSTAVRPDLQRRVRLRRAALVAALLGIVMAAASLTRFIMLPLILVPLAIIAWRARRDVPLAVTALAAGLVCFVLAYSPWMVRNWRTEGRLIVLTSSRDSVSRQAHETARLMRGGMDLTSAGRLATASAAAASTGQGEMRPPGPLSADYWRDVRVRLQIMLGVHPQVAAPFPLTGTTTEDRPLVRRVTYAWHVALYALVLAALVSCLKRHDERMLAVLALPGALIVLYVLVHAIPRYQFVPFVGLTVAAGAMLGVLDARAGRSAAAMGGPER